MLFLKALFITTLLFFGTAQCLTNSKDTGKLTFTESLKDFFKPSKEPTTYELLNDLVKNRANNGLRDYKNYINDLDIPEIKEVLKDAGQYVVIQLNILTNDIQSILKDVEAFKVTLYGYRLGSPSDANIENATRLFLLATSVRVVLYLVENILFLCKSPFYRLLY